MPSMRRRYGRCRCGLRCTAVSERFVSESRIQAVTRLASTKFVLFGSIVISEPLLSPHKTKRTTPLTMTDDLKPGTNALCYSRRALLHLAPSLSFLVRNNHSNTLPFSCSLNQQLLFFNPFTGQKFPTPTPGFGDRVFYETLLRQRPGSAMAEEW